MVKTPGQLPTGLRCESHTNMLHGGAIFHDAPPKYVHIENQVSLGVGETVNSTLKFEEWLWEQARLSIKH